MIYWIWLSKIPTIGCYTSRLLLKELKEPKKIYEASYEELIRIKGIGPQKAKRIYETKSLNKAYKILNDCEKKGIRIMTISDDNYPKEARNIDDLPICLYYKGTIRNDIRKTAIVGSRRCDRAARQRTIEIATDLTRQGNTIVSGMAKGVDAYAQTACLKAGGYTIAVLGNGLDICYPSEHRILMEKIERQGLLISEYEPGVRPQKVYFPRRNRIIAALSEEIIVTSARKGSGALITAQYGEKYHKKVTFAGLNKTISQFTNS